MLAFVATTRSPECVVAGSATRTRPRAFMWRAQERVVNIKDITSGKARVLPQVFRKPSWRYRVTMVPHPRWGTMQALHNLRNDYDMREKIGKGSFGVTWIAIEKKSQARHACKVKARSHARTGASAHAHPRKCHASTDASALHACACTCTRAHAHTHARARIHNMNAQVQQICKVAVRGRIGPYALLAV